MVSQASRVDSICQACASESRLDVGAGSMTAIWLLGCVPVCCVDGAVIVWAMFGLCLGYVCLALAAPQVALGG